MNIGMRQFSAGTVDALISAAGDSSSTRGGLARLLCEWEGWTDSRGRPAVSAACKVLPLLAQKAGFELPEARRGVPQGTSEALPPEGLDGLQGMRLRRAALGDVSLVAAASRAERRSWDAMVGAWHPPGARIRYWVHSSGSGILGGIAFSAAGWHQKARDRWIGWDLCARARNLQRVICNHRFLLVPRVHGLASAVLRLAREQVVADWREQYAVAPVLFPHPTECRAAYRLLSNGQVDMAHILEPHQASTVERCAAEPLVLAIQDTTSLNYHGLKQTEGLVGIGGRGRGRRGSWPISG